jgi:hypothetical protein
MTTTTQRSDLHKLVDSLPDDSLDEAKSLLRLLSEEPDELLEEEASLVQDAKEDFETGRWVKWEDIRRTDV